MKKKGFTLMELLAVIVILAVLALITIPIVSNLIKNSKKEAFRISVGQVSDNIFFHYTKDWLIEGMDEDKVFDFETHQNLDLLTVSGSLPTSGSMSINPQGKISINVSNGVYCAVKTIEQDKIQVGDIVDGVCQLTGEEVSTCSVRVGYTWDFDYIATGEDRSQEFTIPCSGNYKLEVWGAQGGSYNDEYHGGYGGYSTGEINIEKDKSIFINIGGSGCISSNSDICGGYNGGGTANSQSSNDYAGGGGGATHIALESGLLSTFKDKKDKLLIVAAGGGGAYYYSDFHAYGASGGGYIGGTVKNGYCRYRTLTLGTGGSQEIGGNPNKCDLATGVGSFGHGGNGSAWSSGGGAGYYGGGAGYAYGANGGSGYIGSVLLTNKFMYCYDCNSTIGEDIYTISGNSVNSAAITSNAKKGNGYARITYLGEKQTEFVIACVKGMSWEYNYKEENGSGVEQTFMPSCTGYYKLEVWGAQGGSSGTNYPGGTGGYSTGIVKLSKDKSLYINVGGQGKAVSGYNQSVAGGYNGGGSGCSSDNRYYRYSSSGGGATHIAFESGLLTTFNPNLENSKHDKLLIVAGGGGGTWNIGYSSGWETVTPGTGGGYQGGTEVGKESGNVYTTIGGNQTTGFAFGQGFNYVCGNAGGGAGGGYYGGLQGQFGGSGGSGYIGYNTMIRKSMYCNNCNESGDESIRTIMTTASSSNPTSREAKIGNGYAKITFVGESIDTSIKYEEGDFFTFSYKEENGSGVEQTFTVPVTGKYKIELWGASGGNINNAQGGKGAYTSGTIELNSGVDLYIYIGEHVDGYADKITFNGGGRGSYSTHNDYNANGGGGTDVRLVNGSWDNFDSLKSRIMVAAGGGGASDWGGQCINGGYGGALTGGNGDSKWGSTHESLEVAKGGTQTQGGLYANKSPSYSSSCLIGRFGKGGTSLNYTADWIYYSGGGSGYFGGGAGGCASNIVGSAAGGSSFISGYPGCNAISKASTESNIIHTDQPNHYSGYIFTSGVMKSGNENMPSYNSTSTMTGNTGNGYARITLLEIK